MATEQTFNAQVVDGNNLLAPFLVLYDKNTNLPVLDPCFESFQATLECLHTITKYSELAPVEGEQINCDECHVLKKVIYSKYTGIPEAKQMLRTKEAHKVSINLVSWNLVSKSGMRAGTRPHQDAHGKIDVRVDYFQGKKTPMSDLNDDYDGIIGGRPTEQDIKAGYKPFVTIPYTNTDTYAQFEVPEQIIDTNWLINLRIRATLMANIPDVRFARMRVVKRRDFGEFEYEVDKQITINDLLKEPPDKSVKVMGPIG